MRTRILTALIETRQHVAAGWVQWVWKDEGGCCLVGALSAPAISISSPGIWMMIIGSIEPSMIV
jgi:hypothetical protein